MRSFRYDGLPGRVVFGHDAARSDLVSEVDGLGGHRILLITTKRGEPLATELAGPLGERIAAVFTGVREHVPAETAAAAQTVAEDARADCLLCVGGGSAVGTAKVVALDRALPIVAIPTTYAGSEMTPVWGLTEFGRKRTGRSMSVLPRVVIYDPELTTTLPAGITAASGMNAMAHCVEAGYAPGANPITSLVAREGVRALAGGLPVAIKQPDNPSGRADALYGAYLAGAAFAVAGSSIHHKICHVLGGAYGLPHAQTHAVLLPYVAALVEPGAPDRMRDLAAALGASRAPQGLRELAGRLGAPTSLRELGMRAEDLEEAAGLVLAQVPDGTPVPVDEPALRDLLAAAFAGGWEELS